MIYLCLMHAATFLITSEYARTALARLGTRSLFTFVPHVHTCTIIFLPSPTRQLNSALNQAQCNFYKYSAIEIATN